jgi:hypothetical protein
MKKKFDINEACEYIASTSDETKIYVGTDSERHKYKGVWYADYMTAIVVHIDGCKGCRLFGTILTERDFDSRIDRPKLRLMREVMLSAQMYIDIADAIGNRHAEIHMDINGSKMFGSSCIVDEAIGYVRGMTNIIPMIKPDAHAASYGADRLKEILGERKMI